MMRCIAPLLLALALGSFGCGGASFRDPEMKTLSTYVVVKSAAEGPTTILLWDWIDSRWGPWSGLSRQRKHADWVIRKSDFGTLRSSVDIEVLDDRVAIFRFEMHVENRRGGLPDSAWAEMARAEWDSIMAKTPWGPVSGGPWTAKEKRPTATALGRSPAGGHPSVP